MNTQEAARYCGVSPRTIGNWMRTGTIPFIKVGKVVRFDRNELHNALLERQVSAPPEMRKTTSKSMQKPSNPNSDTSL